MGRGLAAQGGCAERGEWSWGWRNWKGAGEGELGGGLSEARRREALQGQEWGSRGARLRARAAGEQSRRGVGGGGVSELRAEVSRGEQGGEGGEHGGSGQQRWRRRAAVRCAGGAAGGVVDSVSERRGLHELPPTARLAVADLTLPDARWLLVLPRHGVGNTLRGWVSAVPYAVLAGRTLVRAHAAQHSRVLDSLCLAFHCAFPALQGPLSLAATAGQGGRAGSEGEREREAEEVMAAVRALDPIGGGDSGIGLPPTWPRGPAPSLMPSGSARPAARLCPGRLPLRLPPLRALQSPLSPSSAPAPPPPCCSPPAPCCTAQPAVGGRRRAMQVREKGGSLAGKRGREARGQVQSTWRNDRRTKGRTETGGAAPGQTTKRHLRGVRGAVASEGRERGGGAAEQGEVQGEGPVWFDVAVHVRTRTLAVEKAVKPGSTDTQWQGCTDAGAKPSASAFLQDCLWRCVLSTITLLAANSTTTTSSSSSSGGDRAVAQPVGLAGGEGGRRRVSVFVATDNEELRPVFVERLQRMEGAHVYWSAAAVRHTSKAGADGHAGQGGLHGLADWWLLSRASAVLQVAHASSFAYFAALFANSTFASISTLNGRCDVHYEHIAELVT
ncbi:unnamed protein product [Closterium sp. NIES-64]|nr:unnamed protein product [Closterium sp. NIES-64]